MVITPARAPRLSRKAFTLVENVVVIGIIALIAAIGFAMYGTGQQTAQQYQAVQEETPTKLMINRYGKRVGQLASNNGRSKGKGKGNSGGNGNGNGNGNGQ